MAGNSNDVYDVSNTSKPAKGTTEKKKRKRPSKKVPTTVLQANSSGFMHLVQKLTGSAEELAAGESHNNPSPYQSPYSSPSKHTATADHHGHHQSTTNDIVHTSGYANYSSAPYTTAPAYSHQDVVFQPDPYQQYNHHEHASNNYSGYSGYSGYGTTGEGGYVGGSGSGRHGEDDDHSYAYSASRDLDPGFSSRGMDPNNDGMSPFSWRDPINHNSSSDYYWYHVVRPIA